MGSDEVWGSDYTWTMNAWVQAIVWRYKAGLLSDPATACAEELMCVYNNLEHTNYFRKVRRSNLERSNESSFSYFSDYVEKCVST